MVPAAELEVEVGSEVVCCVLGVEGEVVRVSLDPALVEGCRRGEGEKGRRKKRKSSSHQPVVRGVARPTLISPPPSLSLLP